MGGVVGSKCRGENAGFHIKKPVQTESKDSRFCGSDLLRIF